MSIHEHSSREIVAYLDHKIQNMCEAAYANARAAELGHKHVHFLEHRGVVLGVVACNRQDLWFIGHD